MKRHIRLNTPFETTDIPLSEYPRPQFQRDSYVTLNGKWQYAIYRNSERFDGYQGDILVPYSPESLLSGLPEGTMVTPQDVLYYHRTFTLPEDFLKDKTIIHFGAVDYECKVTVNGKLIGEHTGGYTPFTMDLSGVVHAGENTIDVVVTDPPRAGCSRQFLSSLVKLAPAKVIYVSCNPETQARDLQYLTANGYKVDRIRPVDMFPFTRHIECVVKLSRR